MSAAPALAPAPSPVSEYVTKTEEIAEYIGKITECTGVKTSETLSAETLVAKPVITRSFVVIRENCVSLRGLFELVLGFGVIRVAVGMVLHRQPAICCFNIAR